MVHYFSITSFKRGRKDDLFASQFSDLISFLVTGPQTPKGIMEWLQTQTYIIDNDINKLFLDTLHLGREKTLQFMTMYAVTYLFLNSSTIRVYFSISVG